ncbi:MAG: transporter substrate-binding domain-containing protein [Clostridia bacterium]|jgi:signal transduction histidine kinase/ActR/RegA family two-component response regulator|nr:transporter substrate-binding domain-containing protein [Clostridia bacterium]
MRKNTYSVISVILIIAAILSFSINTYANEKTVKIAVVDYPNYIQMHEDGTVSGFAYEYLEEIKKFTKWNYDYIEMSYPEAIKAVETGKIDILAGCQYTDDRAKVCNFSKRDMGHGGTVLCVLPGNNGYAYNDVTSFSGMRIATLKDSVRTQQANVFLKQYGSDVKFIEYDSDIDSKKALESGEVDAILMNDIRCESDLKVIARLSETPLYFMLNKNDPSIKNGIDYAQEQIHLENPYYESDLNNKYYSGILKQTALTESEKKFVFSSEPIKVAVSNDMKPMEYYDKKSGRYKGIVIDTFDLINKYTGLRFEYVERKGIEDTNYEMANNNLQLVASVNDNTDTSNKLNVKFTVPYYSNTVTAVANKKVDNYRDSSCRVVILQGYPSFDSIADDIGYKNVEYASSFEECVEKVNSGKADVTFVLSYSMDRLLKHKYYKNLVTLSLPYADFNFCIGVYKYTDERLVSVLNKALTQISQTSINKIVIENIQNNNDPKTFRDFIAENMVTILFFVSAAILLICIFIFRASVISKRVNEKLREALKEGEAANLAKDRFLSRMSHDMRTPMNAIIGLTYIGKDESTDEKSIDYFNQINKTAVFLLGLINDVLDMSKLESGNMTLHQQPYDINDFITQINSIIKPLCRKKKIEFINTVKGDIDIITDPIRFSQIFLNLLSNAVKFTPEGGRVEFSSEITMEDEKKIGLRFCVKDNGIGIKGSFMPHLYEPFAQENPEIDTHEEGTGLGLSIVKRTVDLMGGKIKAESVLEKGTSFEVNLEFEKSDKKIKAASIEVNQDYSILSGKNILICEDHLLNTKIVKKMLEKYNMNVTCVPNGKEGVEIFSKSEKNYFDCILMDIRMPIMDGLKAAEIIRKIKKKGGDKVPIIAVTANAFEEDIQDAINVGMNAHIEKPINPQKMYSTIKEMIIKNNI